MALPKWEPIDALAEQWQLEQSEDDPNQSTSVGTWKLRLENGTLYRYSTKMGDINTNFLPVATMVFVPTAV